MEFEDERGRRLVFLSHCILDQNTRFPGIAVRQGALEALVSAAIEAGLGIEQLPCCEQKYWGGVGRRYVMPLIVKSPSLLASGMGPLLSAAMRMGWTAYKTLCRWEAARTSRVLEDFIAQGYDIAGIIAMNDSPTCGLDMTLKIPETLEDAARLGIDWSRPDLELMSAHLPSLLREGSGAYMGALQEMVLKRGLDIEFLKLDPWEDVEGQAARLIARLV